MLTEHTLNTLKALRLPGMASLAHGSLKRAGILPIVLAELRVFIGTLLRALSEMLLPEQDQGHAFAAQFLMDGHSRSL